MQNPLRRAEFSMSRKPGRRHLVLLPQDFIEKVIHLSWMMF